MKKGVESGKVYNIRRKTPMPTADGLSNMVYACYIVDNGRGVSMLMFNKNYERHDLSFFEFLNNWEVVSEYKFNDPYEHISTSSH